MGKKEKITQSQIDGVTYRKAKTWQVICYAMNALMSMSVYTLIGMASYAASLGFGIATAVVGVILTCTRILDGITDPMLAFVYAKVDTKLGKIRPLLVGGFAIEAIGLFAMFSWGAGHADGIMGIVLFTLFYVIYVIGYTTTNMTAQTIPALISNDPKQRPTIGVWITALNYMVPMVLTVVFNVVLLPMFGGTYNLEYLKTVCLITIIVAAVGLFFVCLGVTEYDKPEYFAGLNNKEKKALSIKEMAEVLKGNKPLQCYIISAASDKIASQTASQTVIVTMLNGILIGNMGLSTILTVIGMLPSILFAVYGAKYAGKHGAKESIVTWTKVCILAAAVMWIFMIVINPADIAQMLSPMMILYVLFTLFLNGAKMCVTTSNTSFMADLIDYELDRSGNYVPAVVTGVYSFIDKIISSFGSTIAAAAVALIGYTSTMPQPGDASTPQIFWVTTIILYGLPILGWVCTLVAMKYCKLDRAEMVEVQKRIAEKKAKLRSDES